LLPIELSKRIDEYEIIWQYVLEPECGKSIVDFRSTFCGVRAAAAEEEEAFYKGGLCLLGLQWRILYE
jgi:hypothetical protein